MTPKINLTIQVDAPTPEQFERYLAANGWVRGYPSHDTTRWNLWVTRDYAISVPLMFGKRGYGNAARQCVSVLAHLTGKPELEVYNEIVKQTTGVISNEN